MTFHFFPLVNYWLVILRKPFVNAEGGGKGRGSERKGMKEWKKGKRPFFTEIRMNY